MGKEFYMRVITAGRYRKVIRYTRVLPNDSKPVRAAKRAMTNSAQRYINIKNSTEKLQWLLCANFDHKEACFCTFNFRDDNLPATRAEVKQLIACCLQKLRREWKRQGRALKAVYTIEGDSLLSKPSAAQSDSVWETIPWCDKARWEMLGLTEQDPVEDNPVRFHSHIFLLLNKEDYDVVRAFWPYGHVYINPMKVNDPLTFPRLASYAMKDVRNQRRPRNERGYVPSLNLIQPTIDGHWCNEFEGIVIPRGADDLGSGAERNGVYGDSMEYAFFRLPREQQVPTPYKSKGTLDRRHRKKKT